MLAKLIWFIIFIALFLSLSVVSSAEMASENYRIRSSVHSAGGVPIGSTNYQLNGTVGQSSPLPNTADPPYSDAYDLYPGFWNAITNIPIFCPGDDDFDKVIVRRESVKLGENLEDIIKFAGLRINSIHLRSADRGVSLWKMK